LTGFRQVGGKTQLEIERFDGGLNTRDSPSRIGVYESPDCLNVVFDEQGSVSTRLGGVYYNDTAMGTSDVVVNMGEFNQTLVAWAAGGMYRASGTMMVGVTGSTGQFATGTVVAYAVYQNQVFCSDGTNGPWRYTTDGGFYTMGIPVASACTASQGTGTGVGAGLTSGTYYYRVAFVNTGVVEGFAGSHCVISAVTVASYEIINLSGIPVGTQTQGVYARYIYRASAISGPFRYIGAVTNNTATIFKDQMDAATWIVQNKAPDDCTAPPPFKTIVSHKERLFFPDNSNKTLLRYTEYGNPYVSLVENYLPMNKGDYKNIISVFVQDDMVTAGKDDQFWAVGMPSAGDDTTWDLIKLPGNIGIVGPNAFCEIPNGTLFLGKLNGRPSGFYVLSGLSVLSTADDKMRTQSISERIEPELLGIDSTYWDLVYLHQYNNRVYCSLAIREDTSGPKHIYWFDVNRLGDKGQPGSWSLWDGRAAQVRCFATVNGYLYAGSSLGDGRILQLEAANTYSDCDDGINSYWWSKQYGGEPAVESWIKDWRKLNIWYYLTGDFDMNVRYRVAGESTYNSQIVYLSPGSGTWPITFGTTIWTGAFSDDETQLTLGNTSARRIQIGFDNQYNAANTSANVGQHFTVHSCKMLMNLRRQR
jgi:hypothetical protein